MYLLEMSLPPALVGLDRLSIFTKFSKVMSRMISALVSAGHWRRWESRTIGYQGMG